MGNEPSQTQQTEASGLSNTSVVIEQGMGGVDIAHSIMLAVLLVFVLAQVAYLLYRHNQKRLKKKYLERRLADRSVV